MTTETAQELSASAWRALHTDPQSAQRNTARASEWLPSSELAALGIAVSTSFGHPAEDRWRAYAPYVPLHLRPDLPFRPDRVYALGCAAQTLDSLGHSTEARRLTERVLALVMRPSDARAVAVSMCADLALTQGYYDSAARYLSEFRRCAASVEVGPPAYNHASRTRAALAGVQLALLRDHPDTAQRLLHSLSEVGSSTPNLHARLLAARARYAAAAGQPAAALHYYSQARSETWSPEELAAYTAEAATLALSGSYALSPTDAQVLGGLLDEAAAHIAARAYPTLVGQLLAANALLYARLAASPSDAHKALRHLESMWTHSPSHLQQYLDYALATLRLRLMWPSAHAPQAEAWPSTVPDAESLLAQAIPAAEGQNAAATLRQLLHLEMQHARNLGDEPRAERALARRAVLQAARRRRWSSTAADHVEVLA